MAQAAALLEFGLPDFERLGWWEVFVLLLIFLCTLCVIAPLSQVPIPLVPYLRMLCLVTVTVFLATVSRHPPKQLPPPVFWVMFVACLPFTFGDGNAASIVLWGLFISHLGIFVVGWCRILFVVALPASFCRGDDGIVSAANFRRSCSLPAVVCWFAIIFLMFDKIHFLMHPVHWAAWYILLLALPQVFPPATPLVWDVLVPPLAISLWWFLGAGTSPLQFFAFALGMLATIVVRHIFIFVFMYPEIYLFPFNLISHRYKVPSAVWLPISSLESPRTVLCPQCQRLVSSSALILGAFRPLVSLTEWHDVYRDRSSLENITPCDLCPLIWESAALDALGYETEGKQKRWKVKVWQERPISRYVFAKLYCDGEPSGLRLLIHRGKSFNTRKSTLRPWISLSRISAFPPLSKLTAHSYQ